MKQLTSLIAGVIASTFALQAPAAEIAKPDYSAYITALGTPGEIKAVKYAHGQNPVAMVWVYPHAADGRDISLIIFDEKIQAVTLVEPAPSLIAAK